MKSESAMPWVVCGDDWGRHVSTIQHLFRAMPPSEVVVWVNSYGHRPPRISAYDLKRAAEKVTRMMARPAAPQASVSGPARQVEPRTLPWHQYRLAQAINERSLARDIRRALAEVCPGVAPCFLTCTPVTPGLVGRLGERAAIYFCMDDYAELPDVSASMIQPLEVEMLARVDAVVGTAKALIDKKVPASGRSYYLPQGVNYDHFASPREVPADILSLPRPILGFAGGVSSACDLDLLLALSDLVPQGTVLLVGPIHIDTAPLARRNIVLLGNRPYADLPAYVQAFDVGLIPYVLNEWTRSVDPLKLLEYLAAGIPVVSTWLPEVVKYSDVVRVGKSREEYLAEVRRALAEAGPAARDAGQAVARRNTWQHRALRLIEIAAEVAGQREAQRSSGPGERKGPES